MFGIISEISFFDITLNVIILNVVMLNVAAPLKQPLQRRKNSTMFNQTLSKENALTTKKKLQGLVL
jgi:hypothetical protein